MIKAVKQATISNINTMYKGLPQYRFIYGKTAIQVHTYDKECVAVTIKGAIIFYREGGPSVCDGRSPIQLHNKVKITKWLDNEEKIVNI